MKKFNINSDIYIQITEKGFEHLRKKFSDDYIKHCIDSAKVEIDGEIWYKMECWSAFDLLPNRNGSPLLFKTEVMFDRKSLTNF